jgi:LEA14-like dessication related protein
MKRQTICQNILGAMAVLFISACSLEEPTFKGIENVQMGKLGVKESTFTLDLHYFNPNRSGLKLKKAEGDAWMDGDYLGHFTMDTLINIPGNSDFLLPVKFRAEMALLLKNSMSAMLGKESLLKVEGKARVGKSGIYIRYPIRYEGKHNLGELLK